MQNMTEICLKISKYAVIPIKLKICFKYAIICHFNFCINTPLIENPSNFDASFDWALIEKICFCIKIQALVMSMHEKSHTKLLLHEFWKNAMRRTCISSKNLL